MILANERDEIFKNPTPDELRRYLSKVGLHKDAYVILSQAEQQYIQAAGSLVKGFIIEFRESESEHFVSTRSNISHQNMVDIFVAYLQKNNWRTFTTWKHLTPDNAINTKPLGRGYKLLLSIFFLIGLTTICVGVFLAYKSASFLESAVKVPGVVVKMAHKGDTFTPLVEFKDFNGKTQILHSVHGGTLPTYFVGQKVTVLYEPTDPQFPLNSKIESVQEIWGASLFLFFFGTVFLTITLFIFAICRKK